MSNEHNQIFQILQAAIDNEPKPGGTYGESMSGDIYYTGYHKGQAELAKQIIKLITQWGQTNSSNLSSSR